MYAYSMQAMLLFTSVKQIKVILYQFCTNFSTIYCTSLFYCISSSCIQYCQPASKTLGRQSLTVNLPKPNANLMLVSSHTATKCCGVKISALWQSQRVPVNSSHGQLVTAQNRMTSWPAAETPCCDELTGASNAVLSLLWRVNRMLLSA